MFAALKNTVEKRLLRALGNLNVFFYQTYFYSINGIIDALLGFKIIDIP